MFSCKLVQTLTPGALCTRGNPATPCPFTYPNGGITCTTTDSKNSAICAVSCSNVNLPSWVSPPAAGCPTALGSANSPTLLAPGATCAADGDCSLPLSATSATCSTGICQVMCSATTTFQVTTCIMESAAAEAPVPITSQACIGTDASTTVSMLSFDS